jgi:hypothetical protein
MKTRNILLGLGTLLISGALIMSSCKKKEKEADSDTSAASDNNYAETISNDIANIGDQAANSNNASGGALSTYKTINDNTFMVTCVQSITRDTVNHILLVDFGTTASTCQDGRARSGQLKFTYTGGVHYRDSGVVITVTPINYTVDGNGVSGTKTITNLGRINGNFKWNISSNISIAKAGGGTISWSGNRVKELLNTSAVYSGPNTPINWLQAKVGITGSANGTTSSGKTFTVTINSQLVRDFTCVPVNSAAHRHPFISGSLDFKPDDKDNRHVDFGNGACDDDATVTINGNTYNIKLH